MGRRPDVSRDRGQEELDEEDVPDPAEESQDDPHEEDPVDAPEEAPAVKMKKGEENVPPQRRKKRRNHKMILLQVKRSVHILPEKSGVLMPPVKS